MHADQGAKEPPDIVGPLLLRLLATRGTLFTSTLLIFKKVLKPIFHGFLLWLPPSSTRISRFASFRRMTYWVLGVI
ncbi:hypothetical protein A2765_06150 [Candidatus Kaiserbacteria bacterium RIFCSPHIGHO2_01_FULL_56_24]|uniref:Uncharacterized protein n=1 Tax=Candidatus Kaiserbacteria bacterium RIFCSPHIGHO2_01_FULL_56_24 TaxID=1798487 RepID=A0A1F6D8L5_9BACT|nr:MAG: hypothetical protein A2765_06150 [Candidatus Kaiserbacteria bacterium RIFCSPHIGHO2_01_FULL_56_24]